MTDRRRVIYRLHRAMTHLMLWYDESEEKLRRERAEEAVAKAIKVRRGLEAYRRIKLRRH